MDENISSLVFFLNPTEHLEVASQPVTGKWPGHPEHSILEPLCTVLEGIINIVDEQQIQKSITDWPFEHFWTNPHETKHSRLLGYFIDPDQKHGCGVFLLRKLFEMLQKDGMFPSQWPLPGDGCRVFVERQYIDLLIISDRPEGKYAVIIENKVNGAVNQPQQLETYVRNIMGRGFKKDEILVLYLPLNAWQQPDPADKNAVKNLRVQCEQITFEKHVRHWLDDVLDEVAGTEKPDSLRKGMRENLNHYRNLISYLLKRQKEMTIDEQVLQKIQMTEANGVSLDWETVKNLQLSSDSLRRCLERTLRGELLLRVQKILAEKGVQAEFYDGDGKQIVEPPITLTYDKRFAFEVSVCLEASEVVLVGFGGYPEEAPEEIFFSGCMRRGDANAQTQQEQAIKAEMEKWRLKPVPDSPYYAWKWETEIGYANCRDEAIADRIAQQLLTWRGQLQQVLQS